MEPLDPVEDKEWGNCNTCMFNPNAHGVKRPPTTDTFAGDLPETHINTDVHDPWKHRSEGMKCKTCMFHVNFRCRRHAPTMQGYPAVYPDDWCGDHKLDKVQMGGV